MWEILWAEKEVLKELEATLNPQIDREGLRKMTAALSKREILPNSLY